LTMILVGFLILAVAVAVAVVAIAQNQSAVVDVHGLGYNWTMHAYWVLVAGLVVAAVGFVGLAMMRAGTAHAARLRGERRGLVRENARLNDLTTDRPVVTTDRPVVMAPSEMTAGDADRVPVDDRLGSYEQSAPRHRQLFHRARHV